MFNNIGEKIKVYAKVVFAIGAIIGSIVSIVMFFVMLEDAAFLGFLFLILGIPLSILSAFLSTMFIYGFGELIESSETTRRNTEEIYNVIYNIYTGKYDTSANKAPAVKTPINHGTIPATRHSASSVPVHMSDDGTWECEKCGIRNPSSAKYCKGCNSSSPISHASKESIKYTTPINHGTIPATDGWTCKNCGKKNNISANYCTGCGTAK